MRNTTSVIIAICIGIGQSCCSQGKISGKLPLEFLTTNYIPEAVSIIRVNSKKLGVHPPNLVNKRNRNINVVRTAFYQVGRGSLPGFPACHPQHAYIPLDRQLRALFTVSPSTSFHSGFRDGKGGMKVRYFDDSEAVATVEVQPIAIRFSPAWTRREQFSPSLRYSNFAA